MSVKMESTIVSGQIGRPGDLHRIQPMITELYAQGWRIVSTAAVGMSTMDILIFFEREADGTR